MTENPIIVVDQDNLGPAMRELTALQQRFVIALLECGGTNESKAARMAGYGGGDETCRVVGFNNIRKPHVLAALREEADKRLHSGAILAASVMVEIAMDRDHKDRYKAADNLLNRAGLVIQTQHKIIVDDQRTDQEVIARVRMLATELKIDPKKLLESVGFVDAEFTEVPAELEDFLAPVRSK